MAFPAKYSGTCDYCQKPFAEGDPIERANRRDGKWYAHVACRPTSGQVRAARFEVRWSQPLTRDAYVHTARYVNRKTAVDNARWPVMAEMYGQIQVIELVSGQIIDSKA